MELYFMVSLLLIMSADINVIIDTILNNYQNIIIFIDINYVYIYIYIYIYIYNLN